MYRLLILLAFLLCGCVMIVREVKKPFYTDEAVDVCCGYCNNIFRLSPRNKNTYFCECIFGKRKGKVVVISKGGTVYK